MEQARQNWIAEQHGADAVGDSLDMIPRVSLPHGAILALALSEEITEEETRAVLGDAYEVVSITHNPDTHDRFVLARRTVTKARKK